MASSFLVSLPTQHGPSFEDSAMPSRVAGLGRLQTFIPRAGIYAKTRNYDRADNSSVSRLSPYLRYRLTRESEVIRNVLESMPHENCTKFIEEIGWRTYWKGYLESRPVIWSQFVEKAGSLPGQMGELPLERWRQALSGETGIECFDDWTVQLQSTGWLHNHARMWFASIWIFTLGLPWELGAAFFLEHLLDGDPASNTLSWRWVAGLHTKNKHYVARAENIRQFTNGAYFPEGQLNETADPIVQDGPFAAIPLSPISTSSEALFPRLSLSPSGLLVCPEDLTPELSPLEQNPFGSICVFNANDIMDSFSASSKVRAFVNGAVEDTANRVSSHWSAKILRFQGTVPRISSMASPGHVGRMEEPRIYSGCVDSWVTSVVHWAKNENLKSVCMLQPPVGPWQDAMPQLRAALRMQNLRLFEYRSDWDSRHWPNAVAGFFRFRKGLMEQLDSSINKS